MDLVSGTLRLTLDSQLAVDEAHEDFVIANTSSMPISFHLGATNDKKSSRRVSNLNMFSSAGKDETDYKGRDERMRSTWGPLELGGDKFDLEWHLQPTASRSKGGAMLCKEEPTYCLFRGVLSTRVHEALP